MADRKSTRPDDADAEQPQAKRRRVRDNPMLGSTPQLLEHVIKPIKPDPLAPLDDQSMEKSLAQLLNAPGDEQSVDMDDVENEIDADPPNLPAHAEHVIHDPRVAMREYVTHALIRGEMLPLLKVKLNEVVNRMTQPAGLADLIVEIRYVSQQRGRTLPDWFHKERRAEYKINADAETRFGKKTGHLPDREDRSVEWMKEIALQAAVSEMRTRMDSKLHNTQHGGVLVTDTSIRLTHADIMLIKEGMLAILQRRFLIANKPADQFAEAESIAALLGDSLATPQFAVVQLITSLVTDMTLNTMQAIWAEMVVWLIHTISIEPDILELTRRINMTFGLRYPAYVISLYGKIFQSKQEMIGWGFDGDFENLNTIIKSRAELMARLIAWEKKNFVATSSLKDYQRSAIIDMLVQEYVDAKFIQKVQGGARGKLHFADPGTGKTLMMLAATFFIDSLLSVKGKSLFVIPKTALNAFRTEVFKHFEVGMRPAMHGLDKGAFKALNQDPLEPAYGAEEKNWGRVRYVFITHNKFAKLDAESTQSIQFLDEPWTRIVVDEAHMYIGRLSSRFRLMAHCLSPSSPRYLLTGTAISTSVANLVGQVRLMGYEATKDKDEHVAAFIQDNAAEFVKLDAVGKATSKFRQLLHKQTRQLDVEGFFPGEKDQKQLYKKDEDLLVEYKSRPILRMINRVTDASNERIPTTMHTFVQPNDVGADASEFYVHLEQLLSEIMRDDIAPLIELLDSIQSTEAAINENLLVRVGARKQFAKDVGEENDEARAFAVDKVDLTASDPAFEQLKDALKMVYRLAATRNYGVDVRLLSAKHLTKLRQLIEENGDPVPMAYALTYLEKVKPYQGTKKSPPKIISMLEKTVFAEMLAGVTEWINPDGNLQLPPRYAEIIRRANDHLTTPKQGKVIVFFTDRSAMLAFAGWLLIASHASDYTMMPYYPLLTKQAPGTKRKDQVELIGDWKDRPYWNFALLNSEKSTEERERISRWFSDKKHLTKLLLTTYEVAATGLNFQVANMIILAQEPHTDALRMQSIARAKRLGQKKTVHIVEMYSTNTGESVVRATRTYRRRLGTEVDVLLDEAKILREADLNDKYTKTIQTEYTLTLGTIDPDAYTRILMEAQAPPPPEEIRKRLPKPTKATPRVRVNPPKRVILAPSIDAMDIDEPAPVRSPKRVNRANVGKPRRRPIAELDPVDDVDENIKRILNPSSSDETGDNDTTPPSQPPKKPVPRANGDSDSDSIMKFNSDSDSDLDMMDTSSNPGNLPPAAAVDVVDEKGAYLAQKQRLDDQLILIRNACTALVEAWGVFEAKNTNADTVADLISDLYGILKKLKMLKRDTTFDTWKEGVTEVQASWNRYHKKINMTLEEMVGPKVPGDISFEADTILKEFKEFKL